MRYLLVLLLALGCARTTPAQSPLGDQGVVLHTQKGDIVLGFYPDLAPGHVAQILELARLGVYDGTHFHRVEPGFVVQISTVHERSAPLTAEQQAAVKPLKAEFSDRKHRRGILSMARYDDPDSAETSFSILLGDAPHLDGQYTVFGEVVSGMDVVDALLEVPREGTRPTERIEILSAEVTSLPARAR